MADEQMTDLDLVAQAHTLPIDRPPAFPIYKVVSSPQSALTRHYRPGRVVLFTNVQAWIDDDPQGLLDSLGPNDVVYIPIYRGVGVGDWHLNARSVHEKLPQFKRNIEVAAKAAKRVFRIIVGNAGCETWRRDGKSRQQNATWSNEFIRDSCDEMRSFGIEPMYVYSDLLSDCYHTDWCVRDTLIQLGLINWSAMAYDFFERPQQYGIDCEVPPWPYLRNYLKDVQCWAGLNYEQGLIEGTDEFMKFIGYKAGVMGKGAFCGY